MNATRRLVISVSHVLADVGEVIQYALMFLWATLCPRAVLAARLLAAESQLSTCNAIASKKQPRPRFTPGFRQLWVILSKCLDRWEDIACTSDAAGDRKEMAYQGFPALLAMEVM